MLRDSIRHPSKKLWSFVLAQSFNIQFRASQYVTGLNQISEKKVIVVWVGSQLQHSISSVSICYGTQSDIRVKSYCRLNMLRASVFHFERLDILRDPIRHPSKNLCPFEFLEWLRSSILRVSIYYCPESEIRVKSYDHLNLPCASTFNFKHLDIFFSWIGHPSEKLRLFEFVVHFQV